MKTKLLIVTILAALLILYAIAFGAETPERDVTSPPLKSERNVLSPKVCLPNELTHRTEFETWFSIGMGGIGLVGENGQYVRGAVVVYFDPYGAGGILVVGAKIKELQNAVLVGIVQVENGTSRAWRDDRYVTERNTIRVIPGTFCGWVSVESK